MKKLSELQNPDGGRALKETLETFLIYIVSVVLLPVWKNSIIKKNY
jgi:hypothetical protein